jgi:amino acid adenylation domain-containing protein
MIIKKFEEQVERFSGKPAAITENRQLTFCELNQYANRLAHKILEYDRTPAKTSEPAAAALLFEHSVTMIIGVIGALKAGKIYVPLDINYPEKRLIYMLTNSEARLVLTNNTNLALAENLVKNVSNNIRIINIDKLEDEGPVPGENVKREPSGQRLAYILYTSGSTGKPKGVVQNHENVLYYTRNWIERFSLGPEDRMTLFTAFSHDGAGQDMFGALLSGAALYPYNILNRTTIAGLSDWLNREKITIWHSVPTLYRYFVHTLKHHKTGEGLFPDLRFILLGGEQIREHDLSMFRRFFPHSQLANVYGQTESSVDSTWIVKPGETTHRILLGYPLDKTRIFLKDIDGEIVDDLGTGEIYISCAHLALGYWKDEENTRRVFLQDPAMGLVYRTGDLGRLLGDGTIEFMGRKDSQLKIRGFRVETAEIENLLLKYEGIKEAVVTARTGEEEDAQVHLCAYIVPESSLLKPGTGTVFPVSTLRSYLAGELPEYMIPSYFVEMETLPLTPNGKLDRKALPSPEPLRPRLGVTFVAPQTSLEKTISAVWQETLRLDKVGIDDNFFDLGGTSFDILKIISHLHEVLQMDIPVVSLFRHPTIRLFSEYLQQEKTGTADHLEGMTWYTRRTRARREPRDASLEISVIGMAGRFPGSQNIDEFWENLKNGVESITFFSAEQLAAWGVPQEIRENPNYIKANGIIDNFEYFDAAFFNYSPGEAEMMDPQLRILHECSWEALEHAGYNPDDYDGLIGLYAGNSPNHYWVTLTYLNQRNSADTLFLNNNYSTKVSYKLNLQGPSTVVQAACSTSLLAIHLACQGLLNKECDIALAGGVSISLPAQSGYLYQDGMILSPDGHCRVFAANAGGTIFGDGVGIVVLKRLAEAAADGDSISAVIKATAANNDGKRKVGLTAPSVEGQAEVIRAALELAHLSPEQISYVETHGTGTILGDTVEIEALKLAFNTTQPGYCGIGSVKTNIGHLNSAAGAAGFIKTVLVLKHRLIPPSLHFNAPNPGIDFANSPFYVNTGLKEWKRDRSPLRAGVSSFGLGGTNVHVILEEPPLPLASSSDRQHQLILLSARTRTALEQMTQNLVNHSHQHPDISLADVAYTLQVGRKAFKYRRTLVCSHGDELPGLSSSPIFTAPEGKRPVIFMFPGLGPHYVNMGWELYQTFPLFRREMDRCFEILTPLIDYDIKEILYPHSGCRDGSDCRGGSQDPPSPGNSPLERGAPQGRGVSSDINQTDIAQAALFIFEYALAKLLMAFGIEPYAMIGYSFGEYTAACLSGVLSPEQALQVIVLRERLLQTLPNGAMLSVPAGAAEVKPQLTSFKGLAIAIDNGSSCIVSGAGDEINAFEKQMKEKRYLCMRLNALHAIHSPMMTPMLEKFAGALEDFTFHKPGIPYISNVTGTWITVEAALETGYWVTHLKQTVRFADGMQELLTIPGAVFIEVGPGRDLSTLIQRYLEENPDQQAVDLIRVPSKKISDRSYFLDKIGRLWRYGIPVNWTALHQGEKRHRVHLPTYPFERERFRLEGNPLNISEGTGIEKEPTGKQPDIAKWFYAPSWKPRGLPQTTTGQAEMKFHWLLFMDSQGIGTRLQEKLEQQGHQVAVVRPGAQWDENGTEVYTFCPTLQADYDTLLEKCCSPGNVPQRIVHLWNITGPSAAPGEKEQEFGYYSLINLAQAIGKKNIKDEIELTAVTDGMQGIRGDDLQYPQKATMLGPLRVIPQEYFNIKCRSIDIEIPSPGTPLDETVMEQLLTELLAGITDTEAAYRANQRWVKTFEPRSLFRTGREASLLKQDGVYLITGGLGGIGLELAGYLAKTVKARLVLTGRHPLPPRHQWSELLESSDAREDIVNKIRKIQELEDLGAQVLVYGADAENRQQMQQVIAQTREKLGKINGVIHAAGVADETMIQQRTREVCQQVLNPKVTGTLILDELLEDQPLDFFILFSSMRALTALPGQVAYCAANVFLDHFARYRSARDSGFTVSINWDTWQKIGMAVNMAKKTNAPGRESGEDSLKDAILPREGIEAFLRILSAEGLHRVIISTIPLNARLQHLKRLTEEFHRRPSREEEQLSLQPKHSRPELSSLYTAPVTRIEHILAKIWQELLRIETVGIHDDFFELGGNSLKAINFAGRIHQELNIEVPLSVFFDKLTIKELALYLEETGSIQQFYSILPVEKKEYYALSSAQKRLYILQEMEPGSTGYNLTSVFELEGNFNKKRLETVIRELIKRHESLRTSFHMINGEPVQEIHHEPGFEIEYKKVEVKVEVEEAVSSFIRPFDLSRAPLMRVGLLSQAETRHMLILDMHHTIYDGTSIQLFFKEFMDLYQERKQPGLRIQYKDYAGWQGNQRDTARLQEQEDYWLKVFSGDIPVLDLPLDFPRPAAQSFAGNRLIFTLEQKETDCLKAVAKEHNATLFMVLLAIINVLLMKLSGQEDIVVGTPVLGREHPDSEKIIGIFVTTVALRNKPRPGKTLANFLENLKENTLNSFENQEYPFEDLVEKVDARRDPSRNPLFDIMFILHNYEMAFSGKQELEIENLKLRKYEYDPNTSIFDITFNGLELNHSLVFTIEYCTKLFKEKTIERFISYFKRMIFSLNDIVDRKLADIDIIPDDEKNCLLYTFNNSAAVYPKDKNLHHLFAEQVERTPDHAALLGVHQQDHNMSYKSYMSYISYKELNEKSHQLAVNLKEKGVKPGVIVGILVERSIEMMIALLAIVKAGGTYLPLDPEYPPERIMYILEKSGTCMLLTQSNIMSSAKQMMPRGEIIDILDHKVYLSGEKTAPLNNDVSPSDPVYVIYTSGSTGNPKGVMIQHQNVVNFINGMVSIIDFSPGKAILAVTTISFDIFFLEALLPLTCGMKIVMASEVEQKDPALLEQVILKSQVNMVQFTPSRLQLLLDLRDNLQGLAGVKELMVGGEAFPVPLLEEVKEHFQGKIYNMYGPTETTIWSAVKELTHTDPGKITIGTPIANTQVYIVDGNMHPQPLGVSGELWIGGDGVASGYLNNPLLTAEKFKRAVISHSSLVISSSKLFTNDQCPMTNDRSSKLYRTGDLARWLSNGEIEFLGRLDYQVKIRGFRVDVEEIEEQLLKHERIKEAVVITRTNSSAEQFLCAYLVLHTTELPDALNIPELREMLLVKLPHYMLPAYFVPLEKLPLTPNGKIDRKALPEPDLSRSHPGDGGTFVAPGTDREKIIANIWKEILRLEEIGLHDNFFDLGANSLHVIQLNWKLNEIFGKEIPIELMFRNLTISFIDQYLSENKNEPGDKAEKEAEAMDNARETFKDTIGKLTGE